MDDLFAEHVAPDADVFLAKIDVQGYEPLVLEGLAESVRRGRIRFLLFEYWPKGIDFAADAPLDGGGASCRAAVGMLERLLAAGYRLVALPASVHPRSYAHPHPKPSQAQRPAWAAARGGDDRPRKLAHVEGERPLDDLREHCRWHYRLEREVFPQEDYFLGFWSDVLAVAPGAGLLGPRTNATRMGRLLAAAGVDVARGTKE